MAIEFESKVVAGTVLVRSAIESPNYVPGVSGWAIMSDGSVEMNNATIRGSLSAGGGNVAVNSGGVTVKSAVRELNMEVINGFSVQHRLYPSFSDYVSINVASQPSDTGGFLALGTPPTTVSGNTMSPGGVLVARVPELSGTRTLPKMEITAPTVVGYDRASIELYSERDDGSTPPKVVLNGVVESPSEFWGTDTVTITAANTPSALVVLFATPLVGTQFVGIIAANTAAPGTTVTGVGITAISKNGCTLWVTRTNTTNTNVSYVVKAIA